MPESRVATILWTNRSLQNSIAIKNYLSENFSDKEINQFYSLLEAFEIAVCAFPKLYPKSETKSNIRRAVLNKVLSVYYRIHKNKIEVLAVLDNRCDIGKWI